MLTLADTWMDRTVEAVTPHPSSQQQPTLRFRPAGLQGPPRTTIPKGGLPTTREWEGPEWVVEATPLTPPRLHPGGQAGPGQPPGLPGDREVKATKSPWLQSPKGSGGPGNPLDPCSKEPPPEKSSPLVTTAFHSAVACLSATVIRQANAPGGCSNSSSGPWT